MQLPMPSLASPMPRVPPVQGGKGVADEYADWIAQAHAWQWFVTMTSRKRTHPEALFKTFRLAVNLMSRHYLGRRPKLHHRIVWVAALERHKSGNPHLHALMWHRDDLNRFSPTSRKEFKATLEHLSGWAKVELPARNGSVCGYVAKYLAKDGELQFSPTFGVHGPIEAD